VTFGLSGTVGSTLDLAGLGSHFAYDSASGALSYDADGAGGNAAVTFAILGQGTHPASLGSDFTIVA
jgi:Ca2+-binding RTX toxin-like protein